MDTRILLLLFCFNIQYYYKFSLNVFLLFVGVTGVAGKNCQSDNVTQINYNAVGKVFAPFLIFINIFLRNKCANSDTTQRYAKKKQEEGKYFITPL